MGIDILGIDIMGVDILGIDIPAPTLIPMGQEDQIRKLIASVARSAVGRAIQTCLKGEFEKRKLYGKKRGLF